MSLEKLVEMSRRYGGDEDYVLAGGGNTSFKENGVLYVKGSGTSLGTIRPEQFVRMDLKALSAMLEKSYPKEDDAREAAALADMMAARLPGEEGKRPSVEAILHALFPQRFVLHVHPALVNGLTCSREGSKACASLFGDEAVWVPLTKPGYILACACRDLFDRHTKITGSLPQIVMLQNHGVFIAGDSVAEIDGLTARVMKGLQSRLKAKPDLSPAAFDRQAACRVAPRLRLSYSPRGSAVAVFFTNPELLRLSESKKAFAPLEEPFTPDHIVYCKAKPLYLESEEQIPQKMESFRKKNGYLPKIAVVKGLGAFALGAAKKEAETAKILFLDAVKIAVYSASFGGALQLPADFTRFILNWEIESYRQKVALSGDGEKRLGGKIAIVTGGAQGFGRGVAEAMAQEGAYLVIADLNGEGAAGCAAELCAKHGTGTAAGVQANVADEASIQAMVEETVLSYGGLDVLVSNAGILIAGGLDQLTKEQFELVTAVNYTGYFLCAKHAAAVMKLQHETAPDYRMDIIEVNSKSGLEGSNRNFAYAGSKFGGIGLTQSFALELVEFGIKVNAVCPGNFLDGPLWSDPEKGLFRQYLDAGKVPGAKTVEEVRRFYEAKVPMKRGCLPLDVARAICYLVEQQYETGQALPVTGGQNMLH